MSTEPEFNAEQIREMKNRVREARIKTLAHLETAYKALDEQHENLRKTTMLIASLNETLREIDAIESDRREKEAVEVAGAGHRIDPKARKALVKVDGTATDFAFSVIGLTDGGANTTVLARVASEMKTEFTRGSLHAAVHRLVTTGLIAKTSDKKGAPYKLTRTGANEWSELIRRSGGPTK